MLTVKMALHAVIGEIDIHLNSNLSKHLYRIQEVFKKNKFWQRVCTKKI